MKYVLKYLIYHINKYKMSLQLVVDRDIIFEEWVSILINIIYCELRNWILNPRRVLLTNMV